jgi:hypothetical protein
LRSILSVIASEAKQSMVSAACTILGLLRRCAPRNDGLWVLAMVLVLALPARAADPRDFAPGQLWSVKGAALKVIVGKVEPLRDRTVVHVSVTGISGFPALPGIGDFDAVSHMPFDAAALAASVDRLLASDATPLRDFEIGYAEWKSNAGGVYGLSVPQAVEATWRAITQRGA